MITNKDFNGYNSSFSPNLYFANHFGKLTSSVTVRDFSKLSLNDIYCELREMYPDWEICYEKNRSVIDSNDNIDFYPDFIRILFNNFYISISENIVLMCSPNLEDNKVVLDSIIELCKKLDNIKNRISKVNLIAYSNHYYTIERKISKTYNIDISKQYNDDFAPIHNNICNFINNPKSGLVILHGTPGTGKTSYIRHLIHSFDKEFLIMNNSLMNSISDPSFMSFLVDKKDSILILEDCEQLLQDRSENAFNNGISNILNISDGLYSDILNIKIIATFNSNLDKIDKALLRKGRLYAKYNFDLLSLDKTNMLLRELGKTESANPMSLAQIYNYDESDYTTKETSRRKIGF